MWTRIAAHGRGAGQATPTGGSVATQISDPERGLGKGTRIVGDSGVSQRETAGESAVIL